MSSLISATVKSTIKLSRKEKFIITLNQEFLWNSLIMILNVLKEQSPLLMRIQAGIIQSNSFAEKIGVGKTKLKIGFKKYFKMGLFAYLREQRMIKAAELLVHSNKTIKEIAKATGFKYYSNFVSAFTTYHGLPPSRYRDFFSTK